MKNNLSAVWTFFILTGCASLKPDHFTAGAPLLDPVKFFGGHTRSAGVLETPGGKPAQYITTKTSGIYANGILEIEQDLFSVNGTQRHRSFTLKQTDAHHVESTGSDIEGTAHGKLYGNYFTWHYRMKINKKPVKHVSMTQYMYLMPGGNSMIIRSVIRKFGFVVKQITEQFDKVD